MTVPSSASDTQKFRNDNVILAATNESRRYTPLDPSSHLVVPTKLRVSSVTAFPTAMIDSGATSNFINRQFVEDQGLDTVPKRFPRHPRAIDGCSLGIVDKEVHGKLRMEHHEESVILDVAPTGRHPLVLGAPWLHKHNPFINWRTRRSR